MSYTYCPSPLIEAYAECDLHRRCPNCGAAPDSWCQRPDGTPRPIPCVKRYPPSPRQNVSTPPKCRAASRTRAVAAIAGAALAAESHIRGYCEACRIRNREDTTRLRHA